MPSQGRPLWSPSPIREGWRRAPTRGAPTLYVEEANVLESGFRTLQRGAVAQLEEYLNGIQGVVGSNPISSTNFSSKGVQGRPVINLIRRRRNQEIFVHLQTTGRDDDGGDVLAAPLFRRHAPVPLAVRGVGRKCPKSGQTVRFRTLRTIFPGLITPRSVVRAFLINVDRDIDVAVRLCLPPGPRSEKVGFQDLLTPLQFASRARSSRFMFVIAV